MSVFDGASLKELVARQRPGMSLEQPFYTDRTIFEQDLERIVSKQWLFVDHVSVIPDKGDVITYEIAGESIILVRGKDAEVRAFFNVCRHRGSRICLKQKDKVRTLTCPYHAWVWDLEGQLIRAKLMPEGFDPAEWPLHKCQVRVWQGMIFINLAEAGDPDVMDFDRIVRDFEPFIAAHRLDEAKIVSKKGYPTDGNWKLAVENFRECYHCAPAHPEYTMVNAYVNDGERDPEGRAKLVEAWSEEWEGKGHPVRGFSSWGEDQKDEQPYGVFRQPIREGSKTLSEDGQPVAPLMGDLKEWDCGETLLIFGPLFYVYLTNDHATLFRFTPITPTHTDVIVSWLVRGDAVEGRDYVTDKVTWMWDVTTVEDTRIIGDNQLGVNSRRYRPGVYSMRERGTTGFVNWYISRLGGNRVTVQGTRYI
jgi:phenylpropionate dioxygenase-like ring-hydroxylating dioxygenase large terminal subunit